MRIYLDNAATTKIRDEVVKAMEPFYQEKYGNPGSFHDIGREAKEAVEEARQKTASILHCVPEEIIFTGGGTESCNLAVKGIALNKKKGHIITQKTEHHAILHPCGWLEKQGFKVTYLDVDKEGCVSAKDVEKEIRPDTILVSIMYANNEIGTIYPIKEIAQVCKKKNVLFHTDACQAGKELSLDVDELGVDMMTLNGSKMYGPKGVGMLYIKRGIMIEPLVHGGPQEFRKRAGTENVPGIVGFAKALELAQKERQKEAKRMKELRDHMINSLLKIPNSRLNGPKGEKRLANNINISFQGVEGESIILYLNEHGICASTGSACSSGSLEPSHVITSIGQDKDYIHGSVRFSLGHYNTKKDVDEVIKVLPGIIEKLRLISPLVKKKKKR
ncbi:MAG: cysteine desulfurase NifS [Nanoarchaeota archaeon]|nr:cysteine desulfurase NifS [Nanoarchaeota archaeon]